MRTLRYLFQYRPRDMVELARNATAAPLPCAASMAGKTVLITGATSGIGLETALLLASKGASLVCINRSAQKSQELESRIAATWGSPVTSIIADLASLADVRRAAAEVMAMNVPLDVIIQNAGVYYSRKTFSIDGIEMVFQVNHLSPFLLLHLLKDKLLAEGRARIVNVNSEGHRFAIGGVHLNDLDWKWHGYSGLASYGAAKTAQLLVMPLFAQVFASSGVTINSMHPGNVHSNIGSQNGERYLRFKQRWILKSALPPSLSAQALYYLAAAPEMAGVSGCYYSFTTLERPAPHARDPKAAQEVWQKSLELCGLA